jgi:hypothetical protein
MDKKLHLLETFTAQGSDGKQYVVHGYEHLARVDALSAAAEQWEPTGDAEYKLADGRHVQIDGNNQMMVPASGLKLERAAAK